MLEPVDERRRHDVSPDGKETICTHSSSYVRLEFRSRHVSTQLNEGVTRSNAHVGDVVPDGGHERLVPDLCTPRVLEEIIVRRTVLEEEGQMPVGGARAGARAHGRGGEWRSK